VPTLFFKNACMLMAHVVRHRNRKQGL
jgi:hypothetical protein